jgi:hypothetical protein
VNHSGICLEGLRKPTKTLGEDSRSEDRNANPGLRNTTQEYYPLGCHVWSSHVLWNCFFRHEEVRLVDSSLKLIVLYRMRRPSDTTCLWFAGSIPDEVIGFFN